MAGVRVHYIVLVLWGLLCTSVQSLDNGLGRTPAMGYNTWYDVECSAWMNETTVRETADALISTGLAKLGYQYVNLDDCWAKGRDEIGRIYPDPVTFPSGMKALADYMHSKNLKFGVYTDRGSMTCARRPGSRGWEGLDARTYASWGVDFLKEDSCAASDNHDVAFAEYAVMRDALNATGRPIFFDICGWADWYAPVGATLGNEWRIGPDDTNWPGILTNINIDANLAKYAGPGGWNNPCLLLGGTYNGVLRVTELQSRAQFSMWAVLAAPLVLSLNVRQLSSYALETYSNEEVIAVNQDKLGKQGIRIEGGDLNLRSTDPFNTTNIWARELHDGSRAIVFLNVGSSQVSLICDQRCFAKMGFSNLDTRLAVRDLWAHKDLPDITPRAGFHASSLAAGGGFRMIKVTKRA